MNAELLPGLLNRCLDARAELFDAAHESALRLFNGFTEGFPEAVIDLYACTLVITNHADPVERGADWVSPAVELVRGRLPWVRAAVLKVRNSESTAEKRGTLLFGDAPDQKVREHGVWYAVDLLMHQDAGLYLDTRNLRRWAIDHLKSKTVLNMFAYTGSLGVAALEGGAERVIQSDRNQAFLNLARDSCRLNHLPVRAADFLHGDFFEVAGRLKRQGSLFDCVFLDPPFFSTSDRGLIDQVSESARLINKVRPLVKHGGLLVAVNNAVYVSGQQYEGILETLCADGYLKRVERIPVPDDFVGYPTTRSGAPITDPAPFNHATKIAVLEVRRKNT
jgi:23S rRNA (cytosine1962-C5)-methyltransferase